MHDLDLGKTIHNIAKFPSPPNYPNPTRFTTLVSYDGFYVYGFGGFTVDLKPDVRIFRFDPDPNSNMWYLEENLAEGSKRPVVIPYKTRIGI